MFFIILDIIIAVCLIAVILLQMQSSGIGVSFGGASQFYRSKRSIEKLLVRLTILLTFLFALISIILLTR